MSRPRSTEILAQWQEEAHAAVLPVDPPRPTRRGVPIGVAGTFIAVSVVVAALMARGFGPRPPEQANGGVGAEPSAPASATNPTPSSTTIPASEPVVTEGPSPSPSPVVTGPACTVRQLVLGEVTVAPGYGTLGTDSIFVTQPLRNTGIDCVFTVPVTIGVAATGGEFQMVAAQNTAASAVVGIPSGASTSIVLGAWWWVPGHASGAGLSAPPCSGLVGDVSRVSIPVGSDALEVQLGTVWREVCTSPATVSISVGG